MHTTTNRLSVARRLAAVAVATGAVLGLGAGAAAADTLGAPAPRPTHTKPVECHLLYGSTFICRVTVFGHSTDYVCSGGTCVKQ